MQKVRISYKPAYAELIKASVKLVKKLLKNLMAGNQVVVINIVDNKTIREINKKYLNHDYPTDVLSFSYNDYPHITCEIFVSHEYAKTEAKLRKIRFEEELVRYFIHGVLHHLGYKDKKPADKQQMFKIQEQYVKKLFPPT